YDALSNLTRVDGVAGGAVTHEYGFDGNRELTRDPMGQATYFITPNVIVRGSERDHYVQAGARLIAKITTNSSQVLAAAGAARERVALAGLALLWIAGIGGTLRRRRGVRALFGAVMALWMFTAGCVSRLHTGSQSSALTSVTDQIYFHQTYGA